MDLSKFYICISLVVAIEAISIPQYAYRELENKVAVHKKAPIPILKQSFEQSKEGYKFSYETGNGIHAQESGYIKNKGDEKHEVVVQQGTITYHDEHGNPISLTYIADEKGFRPQGAHLPTPPPIPKEILKSLEQNAQEEQQELAHQVQISHPAQKEVAEEYQYQQPEQQVEYEQPQHQLIQKEYQKQIQEQIQSQLREQQYHQAQQEYQVQQQPEQVYQAQHQPQQEYQVQQYHQAGY